MPRATWVQTKFHGGEWSPLAQGRVDLDTYKSALAQCLNYVTTGQGGLTRRPGTRYVAEVKDSTNAVRLQRFEFSVTQAYVLEFGAGYIRFYTNDGQLLSGGLPYEVATSYGALELADLSFAQSADVLYITHPAHKPAKLQRLGATSWTLTDISFLDGPYLPINTTATTLTPSGTSGAVTVTASAAAFAAGDVGRVLRIKCGGIWLWGTITAFTNSTHVTWTISPPIGGQVPATATATANISAGSVFSVTVTDGGGGYGASPPSVTLAGGGGAGAIAYATVSNGVVIAITVSVTGAGYAAAPTVTIAAPTALVPSTTAFWRLGAWVPGNYPRCVVFNQDRLIWAGAPLYPNRIDGSNVSDYENMAPTNVDGTVIDSNAIAFTLNANSVNAINWMVSDEWGLLVGTAGGEWVVTPSNLQQAMTPTNINAKQTTTYGVSAVPPLRVGKSTLYVQRTGRKLREMTYQYVINTFMAPDISLASEHLTKGGLKQMAATLAPHQIVWFCSQPGALVGVAYDKDQGICGWTSQQVGGTFAGGPAQVESVAAIPAPGTQRDELWVSVKRTINGVTRRYVEVMTKFWEDGDVLADAVFLDSSAQYSGVATSTITGLTWLKGETVKVLGDGATHPDCVVDNTGAITLQREVTKAQVGLGYTSAGKTLRIEAGGADGPAQGKLKRVFRAVFRFVQSLGFNASPSVSSVDGYPESFRTSADLMDNPVALFDGDKVWSWENSWDLDGQIAWTQTDPLPHNITMIMAQLETADNQ